MGEHGLGRRGKRFLGNPRKIFNTGDREMGKILGNTRGFLGGFQRDSLKIL